MKKLIILLIFIPLLFFFFFNNKKVELLKTRFMELNIKENIALSKMLKSNKIKSNDYKVRLEKLKSQFFKTKFIFQKHSYIAKIWHEKWVLVGRHRYGHIADMR